MSLTINAAISCTKQIALNLSHAHARATTSFAGTSFICSAINRNAIVVTCSFVALTLRVSF